MPISNLQLPIEKQPFAEGEKRVLQLSISNLQFPIEKPPLVEAEHERAEKYPTHCARFFQLKIENWKSEISVQLNHGDPAADEARLSAIAEDLLSVDIENPQSAILNPQSGGEI